MAASVPIAGALVQLFDGWLTRRQIDKWVKFFTKLVVSYWVSWNAITGAALISHINVLVAIGSGMVAGAGVVVSLWIRDPLTKGMFLGVPQKALDAIDDQDEPGEKTVLFDGGQKK